MELKLLAFLGVMCVLSCANAHKYKSGECPQVEPMSGFDMKKVSDAEQNKTDTKKTQEIVYLKLNE